MTYDRTSRTQRLTQLALLTALALMEYETYLAARGSGKGRS